MAAKNNDKPIGNIKRVKVEAENTDPAQYPLSNGKLITFPDVYDLPLEEAEAFFDDLDNGRRTGKMSPALKRWLSEEDYKALTAEYPSPRKLGPVVSAVMAHYEGVWGDQGEDTASEGS